MRKQLFTITMLGLLMTLAVASVHAQSRTVMEITIPFDFTAGEKNLPAGTYSVKFISHCALLLRSANSKNKAIVLPPIALAVDTKKPERMVFNRYGDRYFLSQVWMLRISGGLELYPSRAELRLAKEIARTNARQQQVEIATAKK